MVHIQLDTAEVYQTYGLQVYHLLVCDALSLDHAWYEALIAHKNIKRAGTPDRFRNEKSHTSDGKIEDPIRVYQYLMLSGLATSLLENTSIHT